MKATLDTNVIVSSFLEPTVHLSVVKADPDDDLILECAQAGNVDVIVSGDRHLLAIGTFGSIDIVSPTEFARLLQR